MVEMAHSSVVGRLTSRIDQGELRDILEGNLVQKHQPLSRTIRLYISSEIADSQWERKYLREHVLPQLRKYCSSLGLHFNAVDLYNGLPVGADCSEEMYRLESQGVLQLALEEVKLCQRTSAGLTFVTFLAQRYGHKPLHTQIDEEDFKLLCAAVEDLPAKQLVQKWYKLDTNAVPPEYVLQQPPKTMIEDREAFQQWISVHGLLSKTLRKSAKVALGKDPAKVQKYTMSAIEEEVTCGIFSLKKDPNNHCFWFKRIFTDLLEQRAGDSALSSFTDMTLGRRGLEFDVETMKTLNHLKEARMPAKYVGLEASNIFESPIKWQKNSGLDPDNNSTHSQYLTSMCEIFSSALQTKIANTASLLRVQTSNTVYQEVLHHGAYCQELVQKFMDRPSISSRIHSYIDGSSNLPLVIHGPSGSGKTSIMAAATYQLREKDRLKKMTIVLRFLGTTPHSSNILHTLRSICEQLSFVYQEDPAEIPGDYKGIAGHFASLLHKARAEKPIYIFLDAVDQLSPEDGASGMSWLPLSLPPNVKIVLSTSSEVQYCCYPVLQSLLAKQQENFVEVPPMTPSECNRFLRHCLASRKRQLAPVQEEVAMRVFLQCPLPLYLQFLMREIVCWKSYTLALSWNGTLPPQDIKGVIDCLFSELEDERGCVFVSHALGYITAAKYGLTESELLDILTCDADVMEEINRRQSLGAPHISAVPQLLWSQLYHGLTPFLEMRKGPGDSLVLCWSHRCLKECASSRYLGSEEMLHKRFHMLADYFSGKLGVLMAEEESLRGTPTSDSERASTPLPKVHHIDNQPLLLDEDSQLYNARKVTELPHCLAGCKRDEELRELLTDYDWLKASILTTSCEDVISTFHPVLPIVPLGRHGSTDAFYELRLLREALGYSTNALNFDPTSSQLCAQLTGRLMPYIQHSGQLERPLLKKLITSAMEGTAPPLTPLQPFLHIPGGPLLVSMEGHRNTVSCIASTILPTETGELSLCIVSSSWDGTLKSWDLDSTGVLKTFDGHTDKVVAIALTLDGQYAVSGSADATVRHWHVPTGRCLHTMKGHTATINAVVITTDGCKTASGASDTAIKVWNTDLASSSCGQLVFTMRHKSPVLALALAEDLYLASGAKDGVTLITNIISGEVLHTLKGHSRSVTALTITEMEGCRYLLSGSEDCSIKVWEIETGSLLHTLVSNMEAERGPIRSVTASPNGKVVTSCGSNLGIVWDLQSGAHLFNLAGHTDVVSCMTTVDNGSLVITGSADCSIRIWDLQSPPVSQTTQLHEGNVLTVAISPCETYAVSAGTDATVKIYELDTMKLVRDIKGHSDAINHVLVLRDSRRMLTASSDKTIRLWNGETGELLQSFEGHEADVNCVALSSDGELLMSGGEDSQVIFWGLRTGKKLKAFADHSAGVVSVAFVQSSSSYFMISASRDGHLCIRDFYSAKILLSTKPPAQGDTLCLAVSPDADFIVTGSTDSTVNVLSIPQGRLKGVLAGHKKAVRSVKILPDCEKCLSASEDHTVRIWGITDGGCLASLYIDAPMLSCDISRNMTILCGTRRGWVSTAFYQANTNTVTGSLMKKLQGIESPSSSSFTESLSSISASQIEQHPCTSTGSGDVIVNQEPLLSDQETNSKTENTEDIPKDKTSTPTNRYSPPPYPIDVKVKIIEPNAQSLVEHDLKDKLQVSKNINGDVNGVVTAEYNLQLEQQLEEKAESETSNKGTLESPKSSACIVL